MERRGNRTLTIGQAGTSPLWRSLSPRILARYLTVPRFTDTRSIGLVRGSDPGSLKTLCPRKHGAITWIVMPARAQLLRPSTKPTRLVRPVVNFVGSCLESAGIH